MQSVTYEPIRHDEYAVVDQLIESQDYFLPALERTGMPLDQFRQSVRTVGSVSVIRLAETGAGKADRIELGVHRSNVRACTSGRASGRSGCWMILISSSCRSS
jgi:hypothetical protein